MLRSQMGRQNVSLLVNLFFNIFFLFFKKFIIRSVTRRLRRQDGLIALRKRAVVFGRINSNFELR